MKASSRFEISRGGPRCGLHAVSLIVIYLVLLLAIPARLVLPGMGGAGRPSVAFGLGLLVWWLLAHLHPDLAPRGRQPTRWLLCAFVLAVLVSYAAALDRGLLPLEGRSADRYLLVLGSWVGVALVAADGLRDRGDIDRVVRTLVALAVFTSVVGILQFRGLDLAPWIRVPGLVYNAELVGLRQRGGPAFNRVYGTQQHYIEFGVILAMILPLAVHRALTAIGARRRRGWLAVALIAAAVPFSISRAGFLGLIVGFVVLSSAWPGQLKLKAYLIAALSLVAYRGAVPGVLGTIRSAFLNYEDDPSIINRRADYAAVSSYVSDRPWLGRGPGTFVPEIYRVLDNQFLGTLIEQGALGVVSLATLLTGACVLARAVRVRAASEPDAHLGQALLATILVAVVASFTFDSLAFPTFSGLLFVLIGLTGAAWRLREASSAGTVVSGLVRPLHRARPADRPEDLLPRR